jgi:dihydroorotase
VNGSLRDPEWNLETAVRIDLIIHGGTVVSPAGSRRGHVLVHGGRVLATEERDGGLPDADSVIDAQGLHVLPGLVDADVNFREPGEEYKEGWDTGSQAAVCGGITTIIDQSNHTRRVNNVEELQLKMQSAQGRSYCNYAIAGTLMPETVEHIPALATAGVAGLRFSFTRQVGKLPMMDSGAILDAWRLMGEVGLPVMINPETKAIIDHELNRIEATGRTDPASWRESHPPVAEVEGVARSLALAQFTGVRLVLTYISTAQAVSWIRHAKAAGAHVYAETKPHYAAFDGRVMDRELGSMLKMIPPVRPAEHSEAVMAGVADGTIDIVATDHSPHTHEEKRYNERMGNIWSAIPGWPGLETTVGMMLTAVNEGKLSLQRYVSVASESPAKIFGLWPRKGSLTAGADADITLVDLTRAGTFDESKLHSRHKLSPFHGWSYLGAPVGTIIAGRLVAREGELVTDTPAGCFERPSWS